MFWVELLCDSVRSVWYHCHTGPNQPILVLTSPCLFVLINLVPSRSHWGIFGIQVPNSYWYWLSPSWLALDALVPDEISLNAVTTAKQGSLVNRLDLITNFIVFSSKIIDFRFSNSFPLEEKSMVTPTGLISQVRFQDVMGTHYINGLHHRILALCGTYKDRRYNA